jgi:hypothetical protein
MSYVLDILIIFLLVMVNGLFAMSELAEEEVKEFCEYG